VVCEIFYLDSNVERSRSRNSDVAGGLREPLTVVSDPCAGFYVGANDGYNWARPHQPSLPSLRPTQGSTAGTREAATRQMLCFLECSIVC
jgi:hypothetical protein